MSGSKVKTSVNGTATKKAPVNGKHTTPVKVVKTPDPALNLEDRIQRVTELQGLTQKRGLVLETLNNLRTFKFSGDDSVLLEIKDSSNKRFSTSNNNLIDLLSKQLESLLQGKLNDLNKEIIEFKL